MMEQILLTPEEIGQNILETEDSRYPTRNAIRSASKAQLKKAFTVIEDASEPIPYDYDPMAIYIPWDKWEALKAGVK